MKRRAATLFGLLCGLIAAVGGFAQGAEPSAEDAQFFEAKIRPILVENCHSATATRSRTATCGSIRSGRCWPEAKAARRIVPGKPEESLLIEAMNYKSLEMPPDAA